MPRRGAAGLCATLLVCGAALASCGSGTSLADENATQILAAARAALGNVHSLRLAGVFQQAQSEVSLDVTVQLPGAVDFRFGQGNLHGEFVAVGQHVYVKATQDFWAAAGVAAAKAARLDQRWVVLPQSSAAQFTSILDVSDHNKVADCLIGEFGGGVTKQGTATVAGHTAVVLVAKGGQPGTAPGRLYVAADGAALPLRLELTGPAQAGTHTCRGGGLTTNLAQTRIGTVDFTAYDSAPSVSAPAGAVDPATLTG